MNRLRYERVNRHISQRSVGLAAGVPQFIICLIELGKWNPSPTQLRKIAGALEITPPESLLDEVVVESAEVTR